MADFYVQAAGSGTAPYDTWAKAATTLAVGMGATATAGDKVFVDKTHAETHASSNHTQTATAGSATVPCFVISVTNTGSPVTTGDYAAGASFSVTTNNELVLRPYVVNIGMTYSSLGQLWTNSNTGGGSNSGGFINCTLKNLSTSSAKYITLRAFTGINCTYEFGTGNGGLRSDVDNDHNEIIGGTLVNPPAYLCKSWSGSTLNVYGLDMSGCATGIFNAVTRGQLIQFSSCVFPASYVLQNAAEVDRRERIEAWNCSAGTDDDQRSFETVTADAIATGEYTTVRTGAYDDSGNKYSIKVTPTSINGEGVPFRMLLSEFWADQNPTLTVNLTTDATVDNQKIWCEFEHPDGTTRALSKFVSTQHADFVFGTAASLSAGTGAAWTSGKTNELSIAHTVTGGQKGIHRVWINVATSTTTPIYFDPHVDIS